jgi:Ca2+:H+ antiporter
MAQQVELSCSGCPDGRSPNDLPDNQPWMCHSCRYVHPDPVKDPFYQDRVKNLMYICASLLLLVSFRWLSGSRLLV